MARLARSDALQRRIDWVAVSIITVGGFVFALASVVLALDGSSGQWSSAASSGLVAAIGGYMLIRGRPNLMVALMLVVPIEVVRFRAAFPTLAYGVLGIQFAAFGIMATLLRPDRWLRRSILTSMAIMAAFVADVTLGDDSPYILLHAAGTSAAVAFVAWALHVTTDAADRREDVLQSLIDAAPVATMVCDYGLTILMVQRLQARVDGDLVGFLLRSPVEFERILTSRARTGANDEWERLHGPGFSERSDLDQFKRTGEPSELLRSIATQCVGTVTGLTRARFEHEMTAVDGTRRWIRSTWKVPMRHGAPDYTRVLISNVDVTAMKEAEAVLEQQITAKDRFLASISHELRTPITAVAGLTDELHAAFETFDAGEARELIGMVAGEAAEVAGIVEDLLVAARPPDAELSVRSEPVDVGGVVASLSNAPVTWLIDQDTKALADRGRVRQILRNLCTNAKRHGGADVEFVIGAPSPLIISVAVSDNGPGVPAHLSETVWDAYARGGADPGLTESFGLGLYVSRRLARLMDGDLRYERIDGRTVFTLELPRFTDS